MKTTNILNSWTATTAFAFFIGLETSASSIEKGDPVNPGTTNAIQSVMSMSAEPVSTQTITQIQNVLRGKESAAVAYALKNIGASDKPTDHCCIRIMTALEQETFRQYMTKSQSGSGLNDQDKRALGRWGRYVNSPASIHLVISNLLYDTNPAEEINDQLVGERRRFCDVAFNLATDRIEGLPEIIGKTPIGTLDTIYMRDERLTMFRKWWKTNGDTLDGSEKGKRFRGKPTSESVKIN